MTPPKTTVIGSYPILVSEAEIQHYLKRSSAEPGAEAFFNPFLKTAERAFADQVSAGVEIPSTGQTSYDFTNIFLDPSKVEGVAASGAGRRIVGDLHLKGPIRLDEVQHVYGLVDAVEEGGKKEKLLQLKEPITDPYTLATGVQNETGKDTKELTFEILREIVIPEAKSIEPYVDYFQFDAPRYSSVSARPEYLPDIYDELRGELHKPIVLHVCGDTSGIFDELTKFNVDVLSLDFTLTPRLIDAVSAGSYDQKLGVGVAKTEPRVEGVREISSLLESVRAKVGDDKILFVHPACGQRSLPLGAAYQKNVNITLARDEVFFGESELPTEIATSSERPMTTGYDPAGKFKILVDRDAGQIVVTLLDYENSPHRRIRGSFADSILHKIVSDGLLSGAKTGMLHLGYVATELGKAEVALHNGLEYRQDQPLVLQG